MSINLPTRVEDMAEQSQEYSAYYYILKEAAITRYRENLQMLGGIRDPYIYCQADSELRHTEKVDW